MHHEQISHRDPGTQSSTGSLVNHRMEPGKRTLTEGLVVQRRAAAGATGAELVANGGAAGSELAASDRSAAGPIQCHAASGGPGPTLQMLFSRARGQGAALIDDPVQLRGAGEHDEALPSDGGGRPMPRDVRSKMESAFGADFSQVRVHEGPRAPALGARAYAQGSDVHFAPGAYQPHSTSGQELLGHELAHVVQQSQGRVQATTQAKGIGVNADSSLEREADEMGARAARGERATGGSGSPPAGTVGGGAAIHVAQGAPVQRVPIGPQDIETTDPQNRARVLTYLRSIGPYELRDVLQRMQQQNDQRNSEYIQIIHKELARDNALNNINDITHQQGGVWTSATIFYEKRPVHSTAPALAGAHDETDHFGVAMSGDYESSKSVMDSEVSTLAAVGTVLQQLLHNYQTGVHIGKRIDILITGNMGPCDGCKARINRFINACNTTWRGVNFEIEVNYTTPPNDVRRGRGNTTYGDHDDGARTSPSGLNYHHHTF